MNKEKFTFDDLLAIYKKYKRRYGDTTYKYLSRILAEAKPQHKRYFSGYDHEQSWRSFKGKNLEKLIIYIISKPISDLGLQIIEGNKLEHLDEASASKELSQVKRNLLIDYGDYGCHLPDVDVVIYHPNSYKIIAILSIKVTLRERIAQSGYWKLKLLSQTYTNHIKVYFVTPDEDQTLISTLGAGRVKKGRAITETDVDGGYVLNEIGIKASDKIKSFNTLIHDLKKLLDTDNK